MIIKKKSDHLAIKFLFFFFFFLECKKFNLRVLTISKVACTLFLVAIFRTLFVIPRTSSAKITLLPIGKISLERNSNSFAVSYVTIDVDSLSNIRNSQT